MSVHRSISQPMPFFGVFGAPLRFLALVALALVLPSALISGCLYSARQSLEARLGQMRAEGEATTTEELSAWYAPIADEENAAIPLEKASRIAQGLKGSMPDYLSALEHKGEGGRPWKELRGEIAEWLTSRSAYLDALREASRRNRYRYSGSLMRDDYWTQITDAMGRFQYDGRFLAAAALFEAFDGETGAGAADMIAAIRFSDLLRTEPSLPLQGCRLEMRRTAFQMIASALAASPFTDAQLRELSHALEGVKDTDSAYRAFVGARCSHLTSFRNRLSSAVFSSVLNPVYLSAPWFVDRSLVASDLAIPASRLLAEQRRKAFAFFRDASRLGNEEDYVSLPVIGLKVGNPYGFYGLNDYLSLISPFDEDAARWDVTRVGVAAERYRLVHGNWPGQLAALAPEFITDLPADLYDGNPLRYLRRKDGIVVYSIGPDLKDDGGVELARHHDGRGNGDITFELTSPPTTRLD